MFGPDPRFSTNPQAIQAEHLASVASTCFTALEPAWGCFLRARAVRAP